MTPTETYAKIKRNYERQRELHREANELLNESWKLIKSLKEQL